MSDLQNTPFLNLSFLLWLDWDYGFWGKVPFSLCHVKGIYYQRDTTVDDDLDHLAEVVLVRFLHHIITVPSSFSTVIFGRKSLCSPQLKDGELYNLP